MKVVSLWVAVAVPDWAEDDYTVVVSDGASGGQAECVSTIEGICNFVHGQVRLTMENLA